MPSPIISSFKGLQNVSDALRLDLGWLTVADNINVTDTGAIAKRKGYNLALAGNIASAYATLDAKRLYLIDSGSLKVMAGSVALTLQALASTNPMYWAEVNENVYFNNGMDSGVIAPDHSISAWRDATTSNGAGFKGDDGADLDVLYDTLPLDTDVIQHWKGRMYAAQYLASEAQTVIWFSEPMGFHLFSLDKDFFMVPGRVTMLAPHDAALIVGTDASVYAYDIAKLDLLADYGVVPGQHWSEDDKKVFFWTDRGLCSGLPFMNHTEKHVSVAPGVRAGGAVLNTGGQRRYVVAIEQGSAAYNSR